MKKKKKNKRIKKKNKEDKNIKKNNNNDKKCKKIKIQSIYINN